MNKEEIVELKARDLRKLAEIDEHLGADLINISMCDDVLDGLEKNKIDEESFTERPTELFWSYLRKIDDIASGIRDLENSRLDMQSISDVEAALDEKAQANDEIVCNAFLSVQNETLIDLVAAEVDGEYKKEISGLEAALADARKQRKGFVAPSGRSITWVFKGSALKAVGFAIVMAFVASLITMCLPLPTDVAARLSYPLWAAFLVVKGVANYFSLNDGNARLRNAEAKRAELDAAVKNAEEKLAQTKKRQQSSRSSLIESKQNAYKAENDELEQKNALANERVSAADEKLSNLPSVDEILQSGTSLVSGLKSYYSDQKAANEAAAAPYFAAMRDAGYLDKALDIDWLKGVASRWGDSLSIDGAVMNYEDWLDGKRHQQKLEQLAQMQAEAAKETERQSRAAREAADAQAIAAKRAADEAAAARVASERRLEVEKQAAREATAAREAAAKQAAVAAKEAAKADEQRKRTCLNTCASCAHVSWYTGLKPKGTHCVDTYRNNYIGWAPMGAVCGAGCVQGDCYNCPRYVRYTGN